MPRRDLRDLAEVLLTKADGDEAALEALISQAQVPDGVLGFHAQQAVEKRLKAVLAASEIVYPFTHDIADLARRVREDAGLDLPVDAVTLQELTPWAVVFRYEDAEEDEPLERAEVLALVRKIGAWAKQVTAAGRGTA